MATKSRKTLNRPTKEDPNSTLTNYLSQLNPIHLTLLTVTPLIALYGTLNVPIQLNTVLFGLFYYIVTGFGITGGYHRYWSHRTYDCTVPFQVFMMLASSGAMQGSIKWWSRDHRAHHRYTDTPKDPYSAHKGLFWAHMGWMLFKKDKKNTGTVDISDLNKDPIVQWQADWYPFVAIFMSFILPSLVCGWAFGDYVGGFFHAGILRQVLLHHCTFCVNSLAHYLGEDTFDDRLSPRDHFITALVTMGEGYHNFHHEFPSDYRNAIKFYQYDPTKWIIWSASIFGLTYNLNEFSRNEIEKGRLQMQQKKIKRAQKELSWGPPVETLPKLTWSEFRLESEEKEIFVIDGIVYDYSKFASQHPGGKGFLRTSRGRDVGASFNGGIYYHSNAARNLMAQMRYAMIEGEIVQENQFDVAKEE